MLLKFRRKLPLMSAGSQDPRRDWRNDTVFIPHYRLWRVAGGLKGSISRLTVSCPLSAQGHKLWGLWGTSSNLFCLRPEIVPEGRTEPPPRKRRSHTQNRDQGRSGKQWVTVTMWVGHFPG